MSQCVSVAVLYCTYMAIFVLTLSMHIMHLQVNDITMWGKTHDEAVSCVNIVLTAIIIICNGRNYRYLHFSVSFQ